MAAEKTARSGAGMKRRQSVVAGVGEEAKLSGEPGDPDFNESDWTWTTATPTPPLPIPIFDELWEAVEDNDNFDADLICEEGGFDINHKNEAEVSSARRASDIRAEINTALFPGYDTWSHPLNILF